MKLADLKSKLVPGAQLTLVNSLMGPCHKHRTVAKVNTVDVMFTGDGIAAGRVSHLRWPKASQLHKTEKGFAIYEDDRLCAEYIWGHVAP